MAARRRVNITNNVNLTDLGTLPTHPNVRRCWRLPRAYTLFEFYHPIFEIAYSLEKTLDQSGANEEEVMAVVKAALDEESNLLAPLYAGVKRRSRCVQLVVPLKTVLYQFLGRSRVTWPPFGCSPDFEAAQSIRITGQLAVATPEALEGLKATFAEWLDSMAEQGEIIRAAPTRFTGNDFSVICECTGGCGDPAMALYMLLSETRTLTSLEAVGFFLPDDFSSPFLEVGGLGKSSQRLQR
jgi:hypothetical protein